MLEFMGYIIEHIVEITHASSCSESKPSVLELARLNLNKMLARKIVTTYEEGESSFN
ncbi:hypothetical protein BYT27DRAFT_7203234 [Phlegmacium glaucopus]|nr:hypothetical protein BYT27DRAFT_7203234 [Phlegmacium glaucopus]